MTKSEKILYKHFNGSTNRNFYLLIAVVVVTFGNCIRSLIRYSSGSGRRLFPYPHKSHSQSSPQLSSLHSLRSL